MIGLLLNINTCLELSFVVFNFLPLSFFIGVYVEIIIGYYTLGDFIY